MVLQDLTEIVKKTRTIAVVGLSRDPTKVSYSVARYLDAVGYSIIPVNPMSNEIMGHPCYPSLTRIPGDLLQVLDMVNIFRKAEDILPIIEEAVELRSRFGKPETVWMQLGIVNEEAAVYARRSGLKVIMDRCLKTEHQATMTAAKA